MNSVMENYFVHEYGMPIILFMNTNLADIFNESNYRRYFPLFLNVVTLYFKYEPLLSIQIF
jgi:hypothetical protein